MDIDNLIHQENLFYEDCILIGNSKIIGFNRVGNRILIDELMTIDETQISEIGYLFSEEIDGSKYEGGEATDHGSYGFFLKKTGDVLNWALMSLESNPFMKVEVCSGYVRFLSTSGTTWVVPDDDITRVFVQTNNSDYFQPV